MKEREKFQARSSLTGSRIRAARLDAGLKQAELARACDISASYLNLIEHNRRRIGGALLVRLARVVGVDPGQLSEGAEAALTSAIETAAARHPETRAETGRAEELAGRFPGWARLIQAQLRETERLQRVIEGLNDRLTHDPFLSASLHDVLSSVTAIRSSSGILAEGGDISPEWQARFHRNILEDSRRLTETTQSLVSYLDAGADVERGMSLPQEELDGWLGAGRWEVPELEADPDTSPATIIANATTLGSVASRSLAEGFLNRYAADARALPKATLIAALSETGADPGALAHRFNVNLPVVLRRLAAMPQDSFPDGAARGLVACDASGTLIFRKALPGFGLPRFSAACPLWPLYQALQRPMQPIRAVLRTSGREQAWFNAWAIADIRHPEGFDAPAVVEAWMLLEARQAGDDGVPAIEIGTSCRVCAKPSCPARREPPLVAMETRREEENPDFAVI